MPRGPLPKPRLPYRCRLGRRRRFDLRRPSTSVRGAASARTGARRRSRRLPAAPGSLWPTASGLRPVEPGCPVAGGARPRASNPPAARRSQPPPPERRGGGGPPPRALKPPKPPGESRPPPEGGGGGAPPRGGSRRRPPPPARCGGVASPGGPPHRAPPPAHFLAKGQPRERIQDRHTFAV